MTRIGRSGPISSNCRRPNSSSTTTTGAAWQRVPRRVDRIEQRLLLVEIGAIDGIAEPDHPVRVATLPANLEFHDPHRDLPRRRGRPRPKFCRSARRRSDLVVALCRFPQPTILKRSGRLKANLYSNVLIADGCGKKWRFPGQLAA